MHPHSRMYESLLRIRNRGFSPTGILDIGAYGGDWARGARSLFPDSHILMIEALAEREEKLRQTVS